MRFQDPAQFRTLNDSSRCSTFKNPHFHFHSCTYHPRKLGERFTKVFRKQGVRARTTFEQFPVQICRLVYPPGYQSANHKKMSVGHFGDYRDMRMCGCADVRKYIAPPLLLLGIRPFRSTLAEAARVFVHRACLYCHRVGHLYGPTCQDKEAAHLGQRSKTGSNFPQYLLCGV